MLPLPILLQGLLILIVIPAAVIDIRQRRIPNWLTGAGFLLGIGLNAFLNQGSGILRSFEGAGLALLIYLPLFILRGIGGGDVKLMVAVGAVAGARDWLVIFCLTSIIGGVAALAVIIARGRIRKTFENLWLIFASILSGHAPYRASPELDVGSERAARLPHGVFITAGSLLFLLAQTVTL